jgi:hypothetical protein
MTYSPLSLARRHVLGDLYGRCDALKGSVPVYLAGEKPELLGHADESLGRYADAFSFHLTDDMCKKLSAGHFTYTFDYRPSNPTKTDSRSRITLRSITLTSRRGYAKPIPRRAA